jgi:hypothetical protein
LEFAPDEVLLLQRFRKQRPKVVTSADQYSFCVPLPLGCDDASWFGRRDLRIEFKSHVELGCHSEGVRHDAFTLRFALDCLRRVRPRVLYVAFDEMDDWAHDGRYDPY